MGGESATKLKELMDAHTDNALAAIKKHRESSRERERRTTVVQSILQDVKGDDHDNNNGEGIASLLREFGCVDTALNIVGDNPKSHNIIDNKNNNNNKTYNNKRSVLRTQSAKESTATLTERTFTSPIRSQSCSSRWKSGDASMNHVDGLMGSGLKLPIRCNSSISISSDEESVTEDD